MDYTYNDHRCGRVVFSPKCLFYTLGEFIPIDLHGSPSSTISLVPISCWLFWYLYWVNNINRVDGVPVQFALVGSFRELQINTPPDVYFSIWGTILAIGNLKQNKVINRAVYLKVRMGRLVIFEIFPIIRIVVFKW